MHYCFIINNEPSKAGNAELIEAQIKNIDTPLDYRIYKTTAQKTATQFVKEFCAGNQSLVLKYFIISSVYLPFS